MSRFGYYLSGAGSLDGSDVFTAVLGYEMLQQFDVTPVPVARDIPQGEVRNHRLARPESDGRNSLDESARLVRGNIRDLRDLSVPDMDGAVLVGGGGTLSTWTDYHERGRDCRITERLQFHINGYLRSGKPILCLDNACFVVAHVLRDQPEGPRLNPGSDSVLASLMREWGARITDRRPSWDETHRVGSLPDLTSEEDLTRLRERIRALYHRALSEP